MPGHVPGPRPGSAPRRERPHAVLAEHLQALASETRLDLLHALRTPRELNEIRVAPSLSRGPENPDRPLSRQGVSRHLRQLLDLGLVRALPGDRSAGRGDRYVVNHERLFAIVDEMRGLNRLTPARTADDLARETMAHGEPAPPRLPPGPRLVVAYGRDEGAAFPLDGPVGATWRLGRAPRCEVALDYDPYSSAVHAIVERTAEAFRLVDQRSRNGTWVNWSRLSPGAEQVLAPGDIVTIGRSLVVFQHG